LLRTSSDNDNSGSFPLTLGTFPKLKLFRTNPARQRACWRARAMPAVPRHTLTTNTPKLILIFVYARCVLQHTSPAPWVNGCSDYGQRVNVICMLAGVRAYVDFYARTPTYFFAFCLGAGCGTLVGLDTHPLLHRALYSPSYIHIACLSVRRRSSAIVTNPPNSDNVRCIPTACMHICLPCEWNARGCAVSPWRQERHHCYRVMYAVAARGSATIRFGPRTMDVVLGRTFARWMS
jgi:hypothetical protein